MDAAINNLVNLYMQASYIYLDIGFYFKRDDVGLTELGYFFHKLSEEKLEGVYQLLKIQNLRRGCTSFQDVKRPFQDDWDNTLKIMEAALLVERNLNQAILDLHDLGTDLKDHQLCKFLKTFIGEEVKLLEKMGLYLTNLRRLAVPPTGLGEYLVGSFPPKKGK